MMEQFGDHSINQEAALKYLDLLESEIRVKASSRLELSTPSQLQSLRTVNNQNKKGLKADVKKASMFVNKLRSVNSEALTQCIRDVDFLNLTQYISEIVVALSEIAFKPGDVPMIVDLCVAIHRRYEDFALDLLERLKIASLINLNQSPSSTVTDESQGQRKKRIQIRLLIELHTVGVFLEDSFFLDLAKNLTGKSKIDSKGKRQIDLMGFSTFVKYGAETLMGIAPKAVRTQVRNAGRAIADAPVFCVMDSQLANELKALVFDMYLEMSTEIQKAYKDFKKKERKLENDRLIHGSILENRQADWDTSKKRFERLLGVVTTVAESLGKDLPVLEEERDEFDPFSDPSASKGVTVWDNGSSGEGENNVLFDDAESRAFYEELPDLLSIIPLTLLGLSEDQANSLREQWRQARESRYISPPASSSALSPHQPQSHVDAELTILPEYDSSEVADDKPIPDGKLDSKAERDEKSTLMDSETPHARLTFLIEDKLPDCTTKAKCDDFCQSFCFLNSKTARHKLATALCKIPWGRGELVASYARIVATLQRVFNDISPTVMASVQKELTYITKAKALLNVNQVDSKCRTLRYVGELVKFGVAPPIVALKSFKLLLADFSSHNVDFMTALLESCGRFLYQLPYTHERMENILDTMIRLAQSKYLDVRQQTLVESAYFAVRPPKRKADIAKEISSLQKYVRYLFLEKLSSASMNVDNLITSIRRLPHNSVEEIETWIIKYSLRLARQKYGTIGVLADLLKGIQSYRPNIIVKIVDLLLEEIHRGFDTPYKRDHQRLIGYVRLTGELYNYQVLPSSVIFDLLYFCIHYGHLKDFDKPSSSVPKGNHLGYNLSMVYSQIISSAVSESRSGETLHSFVATNSSSSEDYCLASSSANTATNYRAKSTSRFEHLVDTLSKLRQDPSRYDPFLDSDIDPPHDCFRAQLVVELLNTCGEYYVKGAAKEKLNRFFAYFQRYLLSRRAIPLHVEFSILDMFDMLDSYVLASGKVSVGSTAQSTLLNRYSSLESIQESINAYEMKSREASQFGSNHADDIDDFEADGSDDGESDSRRSVGSLNLDEDGNDDDKRIDQSMEEDDSLSELELAKLMERSRLAQAEDDEFEKAFRATMMESISSASKAVTMKSGDVDRMAIPASEITRDSPVHSSSLGGNGVVFKMLSRDSKGRVETRQLLVPDNNAIVTKLQESERQLRLERERMKLKVLQLNSLQGDEELIDSLEVDTFGIGNAISSVSAIPSGRSNHSSKGGRGDPTGSGTLRAGRYSRRGDEFLGKKVGDSLNLDEFLAESSAAEIRRMQNHMNHNSANMTKNR